ncbi:hypothetical protein EG68_07768 [Paragonimus skrjabini miyazakii]|uniref:Tetraspanin n=1 Tax=Paragonimus skrjabini miyazakii TaxID=59628 RepID=A0A8S9YJB8_9TREM|nr:hypothetical protein EG68_07768 [Paragonimus skrjabini miyazakii]
MTNISTLTRRSLYPDSNKVEYIQPLGKGRDFILRIILLVICSLFVIGGVVFLIVGGLFAWSSDYTYYLLTGNLLATVESQVVNTAQIEITDGLMKMFTDVFVGAFVFGLFLIVINVVGIVGATLSQQWVLLAFILANGILILAEVIMGIVYASKPELYTNKGKSALTNIMTNYVSSTATDKYSLVATLIMTALNCCGTTSGDEFQTYGSFSKTVTYNAIVYNLNYPIACCKFSNNQLQGNCPTTFNSSNSNTMTGCWTEIFNLINPYVLSVSYGFLAFLIIQVALECVAIALVVFIWSRHWKRKRDEDDE